uniref:Uncharacterized protein n=1 Tax=Timema shepardi TaxID=629360 RepID=A0A7R9AWZ7_TIMSH|nr:unnamed protein product [Timema shepardi]
MRKVLSLAAPQHPKNATKPIITPTTISSVAALNGGFPVQFPVWGLSLMKLVLLSQGILEALPVLQN